MCFWWWWPQVARAPSMSEPSWLSPQHHLLGEMHHDSGWTLDYSDTWRSPRLLWTPAPGFPTHCSPRAWGGPAHHRTSTMNLYPQTQPGQASPSPVTFSRSQWLLVETVNRTEALTSQAPPSGHRSSPGVPPKLNQGSCHQEPLGPRRVPASPSRCQGRAHGSSFGLSGVSVTLPVPHGGLFFSGISPPQQSLTFLAAPLLRFPISRRLLVKFDSFSFIVWSQTCMPSGKTAHRFPFNCMNYM